VFTTKGTKPTKKIFSGQVAKAPRKMISEEKQTSNFASLRVCARYVPLINKASAIGYRGPEIIAAAASRSNACLSRLSDFLALTKPEITFLVLLATAVGSIMASASIDPAILFHTLFGTALLASGAAALNQYLERFHDAKMRRTAGRPLPAGRVTPREALYFGMGLSVAGTLYLALSANTLTSMIGLIALLSYLFVYTPLKRHTHLCTVIGAFPGAAPVLMGWSAVQGSLAPQAWLLYATLFLWQFPHFLAIAWLYREDYSHAGMLMLPGEHKSGSAFRQMWLTSLALIIASVAPSLVGMTGKLYLYFALLFGVGLLFFVQRAASIRSKRAARQLLHATVIYLPLLYVVMILDRTGLPIG
jgi:protoheme IX farnesyltransferase